MSRSRFFQALLIWALWIIAGHAGAGQYVQVAPDLQLHYEEAGSGTPIVFIPFWSGTTAVYRAQLAHFSKRYRAISYDPRGQGRSSKPLEGHNYIQHGHDLKAFMDALKLKDAILVGHSYGCQTSYAYFRAYGVANVKAFVCIDSPPKYTVDKEGDWAMLKHPSEMRPYLEGVTFDRINSTREFLKSVVTRPLTDKELSWFIDEMQLTPAYIAALLDYHAMLSDFTPEAKAIDGKIPVLNVVADPGYFDGWTKLATTWLKQNTPHSKVTTLGLHFSPWEFPEKFNTAVDGFLAGTK